MKTYLPSISVFAVAKEPLKVFDKINITEKGRIEKAKDIIRGEVLENRGGNVYKILIYGVEV